MWLGATDLSGSVTDLGTMLSQLPCDLTVGRMLLFGKALGCLDQAITLAAVMSLEKELYLQPFMQAARGGPDAQLAADANFAAMDVSFFLARLYRSLDNDAESDAIVSVRLFEAWQEVRELAPPSSPSHVCPRTWPWGFAAVTTCQSETVGESVACAACRSGTARARAPPSTLPTSSTPPPSGCRSTAAALPLGPAFRPCL